MSSSSKNNGKARAVPNKNNVAKKNKQRPVRSGSNGQGHQLPTKAEALVSKAIKSQPKSVKKKINEIKKINRPGPGEIVGFGDITVSDSRPDGANLASNASQQFGGTFYLQVLAAAEACLANAVSRNAMTMPYSPVIMRAWLYWVAMQTYTQTGHFKLGLVQKGVGLDFDYNVGSIDPSWHVPTALLYLLSYAFPFHHPSGIRYERLLTFPVPNMSLSGDIGLRTNSWPTSFWGATSTDWTSSVLGNVFLTVYDSFATDFTTPSGETYSARAPATTMVFNDFYAPSSGSLFDPVTIGRNMSQYWMRCGGLPYQNLDFCKRRPMGKSRPLDTPTAPDASLYVTPVQVFNNGRFNEDIKIYSNHRFFDPNIVPFLQACAVPVNLGNAAPYRHTVSVSPILPWNNSNWSKGGNATAQGVNVQWTAYYCFILNELQRFDSNGIKAAFRRNTRFGKLTTCPPQFDILSVDTLSEMMFQHLFRYSSINSGETMIPSPKVCQTFINLVQMVATTQIVKQSGGVGPLILNAECPLNQAYCDKTLLNAALPPEISAWISGIGPIVEQGMLKVFIQDTRPITNWVNMAANYNYGNPIYTGTLPTNVNNISGNYAPGSNIPAFVGRWYVSQILPGVYQANNAAQTQLFGQHTPYQVANSFAGAYVVDGRYQMLEDVDLYTYPQFMIDANMFNHTMQSRFPVATTFALTDLFINVFSAYITIGQNWMPPMTAALGSDNLLVTATPAWYYADGTFTDLLWMVPTTRVCDCSGNTQWGSTVTSAITNVCADYTLPKVTFGSAATNGYLINYYSVPNSFNQRQVSVPTATRDPHAEIVALTQQLNYTQSVFDITFKSKEAEFEKIGYRSAAAQFYGYKAVLSPLFEKIITISTGEGHTSSNYLFVSVSTQDSGALGPGNLKSSKNSLNGPNWYQILVSVAGSAASVIFPEFIPIIAPLVGIANDILAKEDGKGKPHQKVLIATDTFHCGDCVYRYSKSSGWRLCDNATKV